LNGLKSSDIIKCTVCARECRLQEGQTGACGARKAEQGSVICANYGRITSLALDPIEKKPLARFLPGSRILSCGSYGCNLRCPFCQNYEISMAGETGVPWREISPEELCKMAMSLRPEGNTGVAFTYNEPLISFEFLLDTAKLLHRDGMKAVLVSNGSVSREIAERVISEIDAMNIDLKCFSEEGYRMLGGDFQQTLDFIEIAADSRTHLELTTLIVPGLNDTEEMMEAEARWIAAMDPEIPLHVTRCFPRYKVSGRPLETGQIRRLAEVASGFLSTVLIGNC